jgi:hypothetical protein
MVGNCRSATAVDGLIGWPSKFTQRPLAARLEANYSLGAFVSKDTLHQLSLNRIAAFNSTGSVIHGGDLFDQISTRLTHYPCAWPSFFDLLA